MQLSLQQQFNLFVVLGTAYLNYHWIHRIGHGENYPNTDIFAVSCSQNGLLKKPLTMIYIINISRITIPELFNYHLLYETLKFVPFKISIVVFKFYKRLKKKVRPITNLEHLVHYCPYKMLEWKVHQWLISISFQIFLNFTSTALTLVFRSSSISRAILSTRSWGSNTLAVVSCLWAYI